MEWSNFMQIYIALDEHTIENGCLVIFPGSHKLGVLPCEDIVGDNFGHKRRVTHDGMKFAYKNCGKKMVLMQPGDILFFNHLTIHGSGTNVSEKDRKSIVLQARKTTREKDEQVFEKETSYRRKFVIDSLSAKVDKLKSVNMYRDFK
jgi:ectoine hydroxylase-related dioxygenase (phytanoyl-CoA dioxygenase family)